MNLKKFSISQRWYILKLNWISNPQSFATLRLNRNVISRCRTVLVFNCIRCS